MFSLQMTQGFALDISTVWSVKLGPTLEGLSLLLIRKVSGIHSLVCTAMVSLNVADLDLQFSPGWTNISSGLSIAFKMESVSM